MHVTPQSKHLVSHAGSDYFFAAPVALAKFAADPDKYLNPRPPPTAVAVRPDAVYTCPMHPQIRQVGPGNCPICGMSLEPADASVADRRHRIANDDAPAVDLGGVVAADCANGDDRDCACDASAIDQPRSVRGLAGRSCCSRRRWCCGAEPSSSGSAGNRSSIARRTCSR